MNKIEIGTFRKLFFLLFVVALASGCNKQTLDVPIIPIDDFLKKSEKVEIKLSPSGDFIAFINNWNGKFNIFVQPVTGNKSSQITFSDKFDIIHFYWANENQIVYSHSEKEEYKNKLFVVDKDGKNVKEITPGKNVLVSIIDFLENDDQNILVAVFPNGKKVSDVYKLNINSGKTEKVVKNPGNVSQWITDNSGTVRIAITTDGVNQGFLYRKNEDQKFEPIAVTNFKETIEPQYFSSDNKYIFALSNKWRDKITAVKYDPETNEEIEILFEQPEVDLDHYIKLSSDSDPIGVSFTTYTTQYHFFDEKYKKKYQQLQQKFPDSNVEFVERNQNGTKLIIKSYSDRNPGSYYFYDTVSDSLKLLSELAPWLNKDYMAKVKPVRYRARDGLTINGYLTIPKGSEPKNLPTVIMPHGGPWFRNKWEFDKTVQFLANRGYLVFQMNYRGSPGYGKEFYEAGFKEWGHKMQDDITDGTRWLIRQGISDSNKIAIFGYSFGGFCALDGIIQNQGLYKCGISYSGLTDAFSFLNTIPTHWEPFREMIYEMVGDPVKDSLKLWQGSPIFHCDSINAPLLIIAGGKDNKVNIEKLDEFVDCLKERDIDVKYVYKKDENHQFMNMDNNREIFRYIEKFLAYNINGRVEKF